MKKPEQQPIAFNRLLGERFADGQNPIMMTKRELAEKQEKPQPELIITRLIIDRLNPPRS